MMITTAAAAVTTGSYAKDQSEPYLPLVGQVADTVAVKADKVKTASAKVEKTAKTIVKTDRYALDPAVKPAAVLPLVGNVDANQTVELTLPKTVQMALDYNRDIKVAKYNLKKADWSIKEAQSGKMPTLGYTFSGTRGQLSSSTTDLYNSFGNTLKLSLPLYTGGLVEGNVAVAKLGKQRSQEEVLRVEQSSRLDAVKGYFGLLAYQEYKAVYDESVSNLQGHVDNVTAQYNVGTVAKLDVLTSEVSLAEAKTNAVSADNNVAIAMANLNNIIGLPLQTKLAVEDHRLPFDAYNISLDDAIAYAMEYRPEVRQSALAVQEARENIGIADAGNKPTVSIGASNGWSDEDFPGAKNSRWSVSGGITYSFFDGGATNAKVHAAKEALLAAEETEQQTKELVALEVKQAYLNIRSAAQRVESTQAAVDQAEEGFKIARVRYQAGVGINLDVLDAQLKLNTAKTNNISALYDYNVYIATLEQVMGVDVRSASVRTVPIITK